MPREEASLNLSVYLEFDLEARRFKLLDENLLGARAVENELSTLDSFLQRVVFSAQSKTHQTAQIHHFESQTFSNKQTVLMESTISNSSESLTINLDKMFADLRNMRMTSVAYLACKQ